MVRKHMVVPVPKYDAKTDTYVRLLGKSVKEWWCMECNKAFDDPFAAHVHCERMNSERH